VSLRYSRAAKALAARIFSNISKDLDVLKKRLKSISYEAFFGGSVRVLHQSVRVLHQSVRVIHESRLVLVGRDALPSVSDEEGRLGDRQALPEPHQLCGLDIGQHLDVGLPDWAIRLLERL